MVEKGEFCTVSYEKEKLLISLGLSYRERGKRKLF